MLNITSSAMKIAVHYLFMCACLNLQLVVVNLFMTACHTICIHIYSRVGLYSFILSTYLQYLYIYWFTACVCKILIHMSKLHLYWTAVYIFVGKHEQLLVFAWANVFFHYCACIPPLFLFSHSLQVQRVNLPHLHLLCWLIILTTVENIGKLTKNAMYRRDHTRNKD